MKKNTKILYFISFVSISIFILISVRYNFVEKYQDYNEDNINNTNIYVLYIPKREKYIKDIMKKMKLNPEYVQGPDKNKLNLEKMIENNEITQNFGIDKNKGRIACHLGHLKILEKFLKTDKKYALIFEDDIKIDNYKETETKIKTILENLPDKFDIIYFDYCWSKCKKTKKYNDYLNHTISTLCRHFYLVSKNGAQIIVNNTLPMYHNGDNMYADLVKNKKLISFDVRNDYFNIKQNREQLGSELLNDNGLELPKCVN